MTESVIALLARGPMSQQTERERCEDVGSPFSPPAIKSEAGKDRQTHVRIARALEYIAGRVGQIRRRLDEEQGSVGVQYVMQIVG
jgi:hypothetical protein